MPHFYSLFTDAQGIHRLERGTSFYAVSKKVFSQETMSFRT
jgi:hypothetical protein